VEPVKKNIVEGADELFMKYGIKTVTMDDIARYLSISKKTIYQYFADKTEIVNTVALEHLEKQKSEISTVKNSARNAIEELFMVSRCLRENLVKINPSVFHDLKKYYRSAWEIYLKYRSEVFYQSIQDTLENGKDKGYFREDINVKILATLRQEEIQMVFNGEIFPRDKFEIKEVQIQLFDHFVYGILTAKGQKLYHKYLDQSKTT
jgi:AcrR family transcriptional regulator